MTQICDKSISFSLSLTKCTKQSVSLVLQRRSFNYALLPGLRGGARRRGSTEVVLDLDSSEMHGSVVKHADASSKELLHCTDVQSMVRLKRKYRMRDEGGDLVSQKQMARAKASITPWNCMERLKKVILNVRSLKLGRLTEILKGPVTFSVDYIEIPNKVQIKVSDITRCEWCTAHSLSAMFLQITAAAFCHLTTQLAMSTDVSGYSYKRKYQEEKFLSIIFESELTMWEKITLEEIFTQISKLKNINDFLAKLTFEEASDRLKAHKKGSVNMSNQDIQHDVEDLTVTQQVSEVQESPNLISFIPSINARRKMVNLGVSESEDDSDELECVSLVQTQPARKLVVYPPPPAKGGFSITVEDLRCLDEGELLNDVIIDFYLKYLVCEKLRKEDANRCHVFSSFFYKSLTQDDLMEQLPNKELSIQERRHNRVKTWTRHLDLFEKDFIFVPINQSSHWYLAVICFPGQASQHSVNYHYGNKNEDYTREFSVSPSLPNPMSLFYRDTSSEWFSKWSTFEGDMNEAFCASSDDEMEYEVQGNGSPRDAFRMGSIPSKQSCILIMDSLSCVAKPAVVRILQEYLEMEWLVRKGALRRFGNQVMNGWSLQVPQQDNYTDCGLYLLQYVESFVMNPPQIFHHAMDLSGWFPQKLVKKKREKIKRLIFRLQRKYANLED